MLKRRWRRCLSNADPDTHCTGGVVLELVLFCLCLPPPLASVEVVAFYLHLLLIDFGREAIACAETMIPGVHCSHSRSILSLMVMYFTWITINRSSGRSFIY